MQTFRVKDDALRRVGTIRRRLAERDDSQVVRKAMLLLDCITSGVGTIRVVPEKHQHMIYFDQEGHPPEFLFHFHPEQRD